MEKETMIATPEQSAIITQLTASIKWHMFYLGMCFVGVGVYVYSIYLVVATSYAPLFGFIFMVGTWYLEKLQMRKVNALAKQLAATLEKQV
jgi:Flp pilus assembly protein TadB